jgi:hypothetical protein
LHAAGSGNTAPCFDELDSLFRPQRSLFPAEKFAVQPDREFASSAPKLLHESMPEGAEMTRNPENSLLFSLFVAIRGSRPI